MPTHTKSAISNAQHYNKQQAHSTTAHSHYHTDHSIMNTLPVYTYNSVHHMPMETATPPESATMINSLSSSSHSTASTAHSIKITSGNHIIHSNGILYTAHVTYWCLQALPDPIGSLID